MTSRARKEQLDPAQAARRAIFTQQDLIALGAQILRKYRHPDDWVRGSTTVRHRLRNTYILRIAEISLAAGYVTDSQANVNANAIYAWMLSVGISPLHMRFDVRRGTMAHIYVSDEYWSEILLKLQTLNRTVQ